MAFIHAIPVLQVQDVARSINWYSSQLGFRADPFPAEPPFQFAQLTHGGCQLMLQRNAEAGRPTPKPYRWDVYLRLAGAELRSLYEQLSKAGVVNRRLERMFYGLAEFEVCDPDGHVLCLSEKLEQMDDLPMPSV